ncbi:MAG: hypothetical protein M1832_006039 [Thelocarpon impressellum]|nr:MAG: hypothetical protein M1832_006039 [Thelocarpon impressellum]
MAQKAAKQLARRNTTILTRTHLITLSVHLVFLALRYLLHIHSSTSLTLYLCLSAPALFIEFWLERIGRPSYVAESGELRRGGEDLEAKGLTEWMWDVVYWSWGCVGIVAVAGDWAWWLWVRYRPPGEGEVDADVAASQAVIPLYSAWLAYTTFGGLKKGIGGMAGGAQPDASDGAAGPQAGSNRQRKMEKRGGQRVQYR